MIDATTQVNDSDENTLKEKSALGHSRVTHEVEKAKVLPVIHHLALERVERMVGDVCQGG